MSTQTYEEFMEDEDLIDRAKRAFLRRSGQGVIPQPGNTSYLTNDGKFVVLRNCNGLLGVYRVDKKGDLHGVYNDELVYWQEKEDLMMMRVKQNSVAAWQWRLKSRGAEAAEGKV
jgi:hypothetical protein